jgi:hypothetical protein
MAYACDYRPEWIDFVAGSRVEDLLARGRDYREQQSFSELIRSKLNK